MKHRARLAKLAARFLPRWRPVVIEIAKLDGTPCHRYGNTLDPDTGAWVPVDEPAPEASA